MTTMDDSWSVLWPRRLAGLGARVKRLWSVTLAALDNLHIRMLCDRILGIL